MTQGSSMQGSVAVLEEVKAITEEDDENEQVSEKRKPLHVAGG
jgi:hypothetical protein